MGPVVAVSPSSLEDFILRSFRIIDSGWILPLDFYFKRLIRKILRNKDLERKLSALAFGSAVSPG
jgi:hypothetical protein